MTASEILQVAMTVGTVQIICDLVANWIIFSKEPYQRSVGALTRTKLKVEKERAVLKVAADTSSTTNATTATTSRSSSTSSKKGSGSASSNKADKLAKRLERAEGDHAEALSIVARKHMVPGFCVSLVFFILLRILGTEFQGKLIGVLPFAPFPFVQRLTARGLEFGDLQFISTTPKVTETGQACSFMFIYFLCALSVKFYANKLFGTRPPLGAESIMSMVDSPLGHKAMKSMGLDPKDLKTE
jgi:hypothetical protein